MWNLSVIKHADPKYFFGCFLNWPGWRYKLLGMVFSMSEGGGRYCQIGTSLFRGMYFKLIHICGRLLHEIHAMDFDQPTCKDSGHLL